ncbi:hypothetical protein BCR33DRAFT_825419 [Rhizoclosmatium globosum]|uniref:Uncharacterized protein n=1 Tax=Rhizoclosmatium globosum TaxID=329046 RepID=A0A1Y2C3B6_9FUNG|nr:hypothetical protein BCR33DRAFT_825419 [Rhizoclosmatium globosum]|eukprot:ORY41532.1 hypothetical protein BCR33DRAFT_825419 [Rhizoclosmatium globosum]
MDIIQLEVYRGSDKIISRMLTVEAMTVGDLWASVLIELELPSQTAETKAYFFKAPPADPTQAKAGIGVLLSGPTFISQYVTLQARMFVTIGILAFHAPATVPTPAPMRSLQVLMVSRTTYKSYPVFGSANNEMKLKNFLVSRLKLLNPPLGWTADEVTYTKSTKGIGYKFINDLGNALFFLQPYLEKFKSRGRPIPNILDVYNNKWNDPTVFKNKVAALDTKAVALKGHCQALKSIIDSPWIHKREGWVTILAGVEAVYNSINSEIIALQSQANRTRLNHAATTHIRDFDDNTKITAIQATAMVVTEATPRIQSVVHVLDSVETLVPVDLDNICDWNVDLESSRDRSNFVKNLKLPYTAVVVTYSYGNYYGNVHFVAKTPTSVYSESGELKSTCPAMVRLINTIRVNVKTFWSRAQRKVVTKQMELVMKTNATIQGKAAAIFRITSGDATATANSMCAVQKRITEALLAEGDPDLLVDLRHFNDKKKDDALELFFILALEFISNYRAEEERRHGEKAGMHIGYFPIALSIPNFIAKVVASCPEEKRGDLVVPSESWVAFNMSPSNAYKITSSRYTSRIPIIQKVQTRSQRSHHDDAHYGLALLLYLKSYAVMLKTMFSSSTHDVRFFSQDDKTLIVVGEPGHELAAVGRQKGVLAVVGNESKSEDHETSKKIKLVPTVALDLKIPETVGGDWFNGNVFFELRDVATSPTNPMRNVSMIYNIIRKSDADFGRVAALLLLTDGGSDHNMSHVSVQIALITLAIMTGTDFLVAVRTVPGHSWSNMVERVMSIFNLALYGVALCRAEMPDECEKMMKQCNGLVDIREKVKDSPLFRDELVSCMGKTITQLRARFEQLSLKEKPFAGMDPMSDNDLSVFVETILAIDAEFDLTKKINKKEFKSSVLLSQYFETHLNITPYCLWFSKCGLDSCEVCEKPKLDSAVFHELKSNGFPLPIPDPDRVDHYMRFENIYGKVKPTAEYQPSLINGTRKQKPKSRKGCTASRIVEFIQCSSCCKWRLIFSASALSSKQLRELANMLETITYVCGVSLYPEGNEFVCVDLLVTVGTETEEVVYTCHDLKCSDPIEKVYYTDRVRRKWELLCYRCGEELENSNGLEEYQQLEASDKSNFFYPLCSKALCQRYGQDSRKKKSVQTGRKRKTLEPPSDGVDPDDGDDGSNQRNRVNGDGEFEVESEEEEEEIPLVRRPRV